MYLAKEFPKVSQISKQLHKTSELTDYYTFNNGVFRNTKTSTSCLSNNKLDQKSNGFLFEIVLFGLNYNAKRIRKIRKDFYLDLQKSHRILFDETVRTPFKTRIYKRRLILFGFDIKPLINLVNLIKSKKPQNSYFGHGAIVNFDKFKLKPGKIRQK